MNGGTGGGVTGVEVATTAGGGTVGRLVAPGADGGDTGGIGGEIGGAESSSMYTSSISTSSTFFRINR